LADRRRIYPGFNILRKINQKLNHPVPFTARHRFLISNILKGFLGFGILILALHLVRFNFSESERFAWMQPLYERPNLVMILFFASELLFGIIPPELFMLWAMQTQYLGTYAWGVVLMSICSYCIGAFNYFLGRFLRDRIDWLHGKSGFGQKIPGAYVR
jgi:membrane protein YqaA with SNARE-associated domain